MAETIVDKQGAKGGAPTGAAQEINAPIRQLSESLRFLNDGFADVIRLLDQWQGVFEAAKRGPIPPSLVTEAESALEEIDVALLRREIPTRVGDAVKGLEQLAVAIRRMREDVSPLESTKMPTDLGVVVENVAAIARAEHVTTLDLEIHVADGLPPLLACSGDLHRALFVLIERAAGAIAAVAHKRDGARGRVCITADRKSEQIRIVVEDDGQEIPSECCSSLFEASNFDGEPNRLAEVSEIVRGRHGGRILFESGTGHGTRFHLLLPLAPVAAPKPALNA